MAKILGDRDIEKHRKMIAAKKTEINKELEKLPVRIDEASKGLPDVAGLEMNKLKKDVEALRVQEQEKLAELSRIQSGGEIAEKRKRLRELEGEVLDLRNKQKEKHDGIIGKQEKEIRDRENDIYEAKTKIDRLLSAIEQNNSNIEGLEIKTKELRAKWQETNSTAFEFEQSDTCPTCGQALPEIRLASARDKAQASFNRIKAERLAEISAKGKELNNEKKSLVEKNIELKNGISAHDVLLKKKENALQGIKNNIAEMNEQFKSEPIINEKEEKEIEIIKADIESLRTGTSEVAGRVQEELKALELAIKENQAKQSDVDTYNRGQNRIRELTEEEKKAGRGI